MDIPYTIRRNRRAKYLRVTVRRDASVFVTVPRGASDRMVDRFLKDKISWIQGKIEHFRKLGPPKTVPRLGKSQYQPYQQQALDLIISRIRHFNRHYQFPYRSIRIKQQKTRWGSCSRQGNLNFNYKVLFLPELVRDYVIIHELCHLKELNHSQKFWALVAETCPDYNSLRQRLRGAS